jgi:hypothetical protein
VNERRSDDLRAAVVVPARPGPLRQLGDLERNRDEIDDALDDVFGAPDDRGPGVVDGVLIAGGAAAVVVGQVASLSTAVTVAGVVAVALGSVLPLRSLWRRAESTRRDVRVRAMLGDGVLLRTDHLEVGRLVDAHDRLLEASERLAPVPRARVVQVAHAALREVATLLVGHPPADAAELEYVTTRTRALDDLAATVTDPRVGDGDADRRRAVVEARREVEQIAGGSSVTDAADLSRDLLGSDEA